MLQMANLYLSSRVSNGVRGRYNFGTVLRNLHGKRIWQHTDISKKPQTSQKGLDFTLMSYNVLSQTLLEDHLNLYADCKPEYLAWNFRKTLLLNELIEHSADVICLQEVEEAHFHEVFEPELKVLGYGSLYKKKTGTKCDGCAIFYKKNMFVVENYTAVEYHNPQIGILDRDNVGIVVLFRPKCHSFSGTKVCVATTHLLYNPKRGDIKLAQLCILLAEVEKLAYKALDEHSIPVYWPVVVCGDFNSQPSSPLYNFMTKNIINYDGLSSGDISGQLTHRAQGRLLVPSSIDLRPMGINCKTHYFNAVPNSTGTINDTHASKTKKCNDGKKAESNTSIETGYFQHGFKFVSTYNHYSSSGAPEITTVNGQSFCTVDYIFYSTKPGKSKTSMKQKQACQLQYLGCYSLLNTQDFSGINEFPNSRFPSDHICLISRLLLTR